MWYTDSGRLRDVEDVGPLVINRTIVQFLMKIRQGTLGNSNLLCNGFVYVAYSLMGERVDVFMDG